MMYGPFFSTASVALFSLLFSARISLNKKKGKEANLVASLFGDEVNQSHLRERLAVVILGNSRSGGKCATTSAGDGSSSPAPCCGRRRERKRNKQIY